MHYLIHFSHGTRSVTLSFRNGSVIIPVEVQGSPADLSINRASEGKLDALGPEIFRWTRLFV